MRIPLWLYHINIGTIRVEASYLDRDIIHPDQAFGFMALVWTPKFCIPSRLCIDCSFIVHSLYSLRIRWKTPSATVATCGNLCHRIQGSESLRILLFNLPAVDLSRASVLMARGLRNSFVETKMGRAELIDEIYQDWDSG